MKRCSLAAAALLLGAAACGTAPPSPAMPSPLSERDLNEAVAGEVLDRMWRGFGDRYEDPKLAAYVQSVGDRVASRSSRARLPWTFRLLDDHDPSAHASVGGYVYVSRGLLARLDSEAQLATVLGHEIAHIEAGDTRDGLLERQRLLRWMMDPREGAELDRDQERRADGRAVGLITEAGYDPRAAAHAMQALARMEAELESDCAAWERQHPIGPARVARVSRLVGVARGGELGRERYYRAIDGLVLGPDDRNGYWVGQRYVHPRIDVTFELPESYALVDRGARAAARDADGRMALMIWPMPMDRGADALAVFEENLSGVRSEREAGGLPTTISAFATDEGAGAIAVLRGRGRGLVIVAVERGDEPARAAGVLDALLDAATPTTVAQRKRAAPYRARIVRVRRAVELERFVGEQCPLPGELGRIAELHGLRPTDRVSPGDFIKCVESPAR